MGCVDPPHLTLRSHGGNVLLMTNEEREFELIGPGLWEATDDSKVYISLNGSSTMFTVESPDSVRDFYVTGRAQDAFEVATTYARTI